MYDIIYGVIKDIGYLHIQQDTIDVIHPIESYPKGCSLSAFVKAKRREQGWTQVQLADYAGVGLRFVRELEQGKVSLRLDKVNQVLDLFSACVGPVPIDRSVYADS